jgi:hypothetical protein
MSNSRLGPLCYYPAKRHHLGGLTAAPRLLKLSIWSSNSYNTAVSYCLNTFLAHQLTLHILYSNHNNPTTSINMQNERGQGVSHATDSSVPGKIQEKVSTSPLSPFFGHVHTNIVPQAPAKLEHELPDAVHNTGSNKETGKVSHATGPSKVPQAIQEAAPKKLEEILPEKIHPTK